MIDGKQQSQSEEEVLTGKCGVPTHRSSWGYISVGRDQEDELPNPKAEKLLRRRSSSFMAVQSALFELNYISDFDVVKIGEGFFAEVFKVGYHRKKSNFDPHGIDPPYYCNYIIELYISQGYGLYSIHISLSQYCCY